MKINFTKEEQQSIYYIVRRIIQADGLTLPEENVCWNVVAIKAGWENEQYNIPITEEYMSTAVACVKSMDSDKKHFIAALMKVIAIADQRYAPEEEKLITDIAAQTLLPDVPVSDSPAVLDEYIQ